MKRIYFDYNASAELDLGLPDYLSDILHNDFNNPSSTHQEGQRARAVIERARKKTLQLLGGTKDYQLIFTSGGTESNNTVLASAYQRRGLKNTLLLTAIEHASVYQVAQDLAAKGVRVEWIKVDRSGQVDIDDFKAKLTQDVFLVSVMLANNETGFILPVAQMAQLAQTEGIPIHTDAVCAVGKWPVDLKELDVDYLSFSSHKFGALKGCGGLVFHKRITLDPMIKGGPQELEKRAGTENVLGILSSVFALGNVLSRLNDVCGSQKELRETLKLGLKKIYPKVDFIESQQSLPQTLNAAFVGLNGNVLLTNLDLEGVAASYGSACASGSLEVSRVLKELQLPLAVCESALRFSFGKVTTLDDIQIVLERIKKIVDRMRA